MTPERGPQTVFLYINGMRTMLSWPWKRWGRFFSFPLLALRGTETNKKKRYMETVKKTTGTHNENGKQTATETKKNTKCEIGVGVVGLIGPSRFECFQNVFNGV